MKNMLNGLKTESDRNEQESIKYMLWDFSTDPEFCINIIILELLLI